MTKNKLEKQFSKSLNADQDLWGMKLHNNMLAHQVTPADYIISHRSNLKMHTKLHLVECKQVTCKEKAGRFAFKRLKQYQCLRAFENRFPYFHYSWLCLGFIEKYWTDSEVYLIPIRDFGLFMEKTTKVSINRNEVKQEFGYCKIDFMMHNLFNLEDLK